MTLNLTLYGRVPSKKNSKRRIQRGAHIFMVPSEAHENWHREQMLFIGKGWACKENIETVELTFYAADKRKADLSNKAESVMDLLVDVGIIKDDNWFEIPHLTLKLGGVDREKPRVEIEIY